MLFAPANKLDVLGAWGVLQSLPFTWQGQFNGIAENPRALRGPRVFFYSPSARKIHVLGMPIAPYRAAYLRGRAARLRSVRSLVQTPPSAFIFIGCDRSRKKKSIAVGIDPPFDFRDRSHRVQKECERWGSNQGPLGCESGIIPLGHEGLRSLPGISTLL